MAGKSSMPLAENYDMGNEYLFMNDHRGRWEIGRLGIVGCKPGEVPKAGWFDREGHMICWLDDAASAIGLTDQRLYDLVFEGKTK